MPLTPTSEVLWNPPPSTSYFSSASPIPLTSSNFLPVLTFSCFLYLLHCDSDLHYLWHQSLYLKYLSLVCFISFLSPFKFHLKAHFFPVSPPFAHRHKKSYTESDQWLVLCTWHLLSLLFPCPSARKHFTTWTMGWIQMQTNPWRDALCYCNLQFLPVHMYLSWVSISECMSKGDLNLLWIWS